MLVHKKSLTKSIEEPLRFRTFVTSKKNNMYAFVKFSSAFILMMIYSIYGDVRHNFFSNKDDDELTGEIFAIFDRQDYSPCSLWNSLFGGPML